jgi:pimeloyl-ACP methyl ester carboxylesterase
MAIKSISFRNYKGVMLRGFIHEPESYEHAAIFLHGFPGSCSGTAKGICNGLARQGILCMRFDFSGTDTSDGNFEDKLISRETREIRDAVDFIRKNHKFRTLSLIGTSTGAIEAGLYAHTDRRICRLVLMGTVFDLGNSARYDFTDRMVRDFWTKGYITYRRPGKWYDGKRLSKRYYDEFFRLDLPGPVERFRRPLLIIHGERDEAIPLSEARAMYRHARQPKKMVIIKGAGHQYKGKLRVTSDAIASFIARSFKNN